MKYIGNFITLIVSNGCRKVNGMVNEKLIKRESILFYTKLIQIFLCYSSYKIKATTVTITTKTIIIALNYSCFYNSIISWLNEHINSKKYYPNMHNW